MVLTSQKICDPNGQIIEGPLLIKPNVFKDERGFFIGVHIKPISNKVLNFLENKLLKINEI